MPAAATGRGASYAYLAEARKAAQKKAEKIEKEFHKECKEAGIDGDFRITEGDPVDELAREAHLADLVIVGRMPRENLEDVLSSHRVDHLSIYVGCPVLLMPQEYKFESLALNVLVAWKPSREANRAVRNSVPLLQAADNVTVLQITEKKIANELSGVDIGHLLGRHGVRAEVKTMEPNGGIGETIETVAEDIDADLVVMGAFGHSKLHEIIFGGVTEHMLYHCTRPIFMAH
jgi:nucleotide-binding universal stress UspA family protein